MPGENEDVHECVNSKIMMRRVLGVAQCVGAFIEYWGFKEIHGRIWTLLVLRKEPVSQSWVAHTLGVSRSLVSGSMGELENFGLVQQVGSGRHAPYEAITNVWPTIADVLRSREWLLVESARMAIEAAIEEALIEESVCGCGCAHSAYDLGRLRMLLNMTEMAQGFLRLMVRLRRAPSLEGVSTWILRARGLFHRLGA